MVNINDTVIISSDLQNITQIEKLIDNICGICQLSDEIYGKLLLTVVEAVNNSILHGNKLCIDKNVTIVYSTKPNCIEFTISDEGDGFDFLNVPDPTIPENLEKECGRGIYLMNHLSDSIEFLDGGRQVHLIFNI